MNQSRKLDIDDMSEIADIWAKERDELKALNTLLHAELREMVDELDLMKRKLREAGLE